MSFLDVFAHTMAPILRRLKSLYPELFEESDSSNSVPHAPKKYTSLNIDFYRRVVSSHLLLNWEYNILCSQISEKQQKCPPNQVDEELQEHYTAALIMAGLLEHIFHHYLYVPREVVRLRRHINIYKEWLKEHANIDVDLLDPGLSFSRKIHNSTAQWNAFRILLSRSKRFLNALNAVGTGSEVFGLFMKDLDKIANPFLAYLGWAFFVPRFVSNLFLLGKHTIPGFWMSQKEKELGWLIRFHAHLQRRWFELGNDSVWMVVGLVNCFIFIGVLSPVAAYINFAAFFFDLINTALRAYLELSKYYQLKKEYQDMLLTPLDEKEKARIKNYLQHIENRILYEELRMALSIGNAAAVVLIMTCALPIFGFNPVIPLVAACSLMVLWAAQMAINDYIERCKPSEEIKSRSELGFFKSEAPSETEVPLEEFKHVCE